MKKFPIVILIFLSLIICFICYSSTNYTSSKHPMLDMVRYNFSLLNPEYAKIPLREGDSAYTEDKSVITLCLKDPDSGIYYDMNTIMYVALHELTHVISRKHGHGDEFKRNFSNVLKRSAIIGIYDPTIPIPSTYCRIQN